MQTRQIVVFPGSKVITRSGEVATVAFVNHDEVHVFDRCGSYKSVDICGDAFGGEHDQEIGLFESEEIQN